MLFSRLKNLKSGPKNGSRDGRREKCAVLPEKFSHIQPQGPQCTLLTILSL